MDQAEGDLEHAKHDLQGGFYDWACFSAQQAAEKAVKAVLQGMGAEVWGIQYMTYYLNLDGILPFQKSC
jgi:HEPN domain-containing protein